MLGQILRGLLVASSALVVVAGAIMFSKRQRPAPSCSQIVSPPLTVQDRDHFRITRARGKDPRQQWLVEGYGKYQCFLLFDSWREAMDQATFRLENLGSPATQLIQVTS